jgi:hypothetical protein
MRIGSPDFEKKGPTSLYTAVSAILKDLSLDAPQSLQVPADRMKLMSPYSLVYRTVKQHAGPIGGPVREGPVLDAYIYKMT